jgi:hypothetical protein
MHLWLQELRLCALEEHFVAISVGFDGSQAIEVLYSSIKSLAWKVDSRSSSVEHRNMLRIRSISSRRNSDTNTIDTNTFQHGRPCLEHCVIGMG